MLNRSRMMRYYKVVVYFQTGVKTYKMSPQKFPDFIKQLKKRNDVIKYTYENVYSYVH